MINKRFESIIKFLICTLISFICITFTSRNSFLFSFQDSRDIQIFLTTARGILDGDVLYRDVFEVKGPYLYLIYVLGIVLGRGSLIGVYFIEVILFSVYMYLSYKIASLFIENVPVCFLITAITGFLSTTTLKMDGGGQVEELLLPVFSWIIYVAIKYFKETYPKRIPASKVLLVSICFTIIFWMKYTLIGLVLGLILYLIIIQIRDKTIQNIPYYAGLFVVGMILGTLPIAVYFTYHNAWDSLWDAYFYKLLFEYKAPDDNHYNVGTNLFWGGYIATTCFTAYAFLYSFIAMFRNKMENGHRYGVVFTMLLFQAIGISFSKNWQYTAECMHTYNALGLSMFILAITEFVRLIHENSTKLVNIMEEYKDVCEKIICVMMAIGGIVLLINTEDFLMPILYIMIFCILCWCYLVKRDKVEKVIKGWKEEYHEKRRTINVLVGVLSVVIMTTYTYSFSKVSHAIGVPLEEYPQYKISQYILDSGIENPIIINYHTMDAGIYGLTNTKPPTKWVAFHNAIFEEQETVIEEYIKEKKADFLVTEEELELEGYRLVHSSGEMDYINKGRKIELFLYAKEK